MTQLCLISPPALARFRVCAVADRGIVFHQCLLCGHSSPPATDGGEGWAKIHRCAPAEIVRLRGRTAFEAYKAAGNGWVEFTEAGRVKAEEP